MPTFPVIVHFQFASVKRHFTFTSFMLTIIHFILSIFWVMFNFARTNLHVSRLSKSFGYKSNSIPSIFFPFWHLLHGFEAVEVVYPIKFKGADGHNLFASKNACANPGGVIDRNIALFGEGGILHILLPSVGSTVCLTGTLNTPHSAVFFVYGSPYSYG